MLICWFGVCVLGLGLCVCKLVYVSMWWLMFLSLVGWLVSWLVGIGDSVVMLGLIFILGVIEGLCIDIEWWFIVLLVGLLRLIILFLFMFIDFMFMFMLCMVSSGCLCSGGIGVIVLICGVSVVWISLEWLMVLVIML